MASIKSRLDNLERSDIDNIKSPVWIITGVIPKHEETEGGRFVKGFKFQDGSRTWLLQGDETENACVDRAKSELKEDGITPPFGLITLYKDDSVL